MACSCRQCCYQSQHYKIWKQFTTEEIEVLWELMLLSITKLQNLKAIHNTFPFVTLMVSVVINHKTTKFESNSQRICASQLSCSGCYQSQTTKFESNSQRICASQLSCSGCYQSQNYKIWKQFTTYTPQFRQQKTLLSITKLQNLKAIHNYLYHYLTHHSVVINRKVTKFESNSQRIFTFHLSPKRCYQSQNYKIWKQFTTISITTWRIIQLLSIAKSQNLKAIHNVFSLFTSHQSVVINHKTTKFESNSQQYSIACSMPSCCYQSQNYKNWKQFTTIPNIKRPKATLLSITKLQNLKAIHNRRLGAYFGQ